MSSEFFLILVWVFNLQRANSISRDERALQDWEKEKALLEADRLKKLLDHEVGGDSTDLDSSQKAYDHFAPASHISYESHSGAAQIQ